MGVGRPSVFRTGHRGRLQSIPLWRTIVAVALQTRPLTRALPLGLVTAVIATLAWSSVASASNPKVQPHQYFAAPVNGSSGATGPVTILTSCVGPIYPGETGHPLRGQTVGVRLVLVPGSRTSSLGFTGNGGTSIGAFFGAPPPSPSGSSYVSLTVYDTKPIPTSLVVPCGGRGKVTFVPLPLHPPARTVAVPVAFVGQP